MTWIQAFCKEAVVWRQLSHPNILPFIGVDCETFADTNFLCMISPWMANGSLVNHIHSEDYEPEADTPRIVRHEQLNIEESNIVRQLWEVSSGLTYLHGQKVVHGDIHGVWKVFSVISIQLIS
jgi:serine/threonine protein kinase